MRAMEARPLLVRAANDGISALIGAARRGRGAGAGIHARGAGLKNRTPMRGLTPYARVGNWLMVILAGAGAGVRAVGAE